MRLVWRIFAMLFLTSAMVDVTCGQRKIGHRRSRYPCPSKCYCLITGTTVRCMHRDMTKIPRVPPQTLILDLRFNQIREVSQGDFHGLRHLHTLLMNNNQIRHVPATSFAGLPSLKHLYLYKNRIEDIAETGFDGLDALEQLYLYNNDISALQAATFANLPNLERLFLHNNIIKTLPEGLFNNLNSLKRLRLDNNQLMCDCKMLWFARMLLSLGGNIQATSTCHSPRPLFGRSMSTIPLGEFRCTPPVITTQPQNTQVRQGETIYMSCTASGSPQPTITWYRNGELVPEDARRRQSSGGSLIIMNANESDGGTYRCVAANTVGSEESTEVEVVFISSSTGPPFFLSRPQDAEIREHGSSTLECRASGSPDPTITWLKNGRPINPRGNVMVADSGSLQFHRVLESDGGRFTCVARNEKGEVNSTAVVTVLTPPTFTERPQDAAALQGDSVTLNCRAAGNPMPTVTWLKNGRPLPRDQRYLAMSSGSLHIRVLNPADEGIYTCRLENAIRLQKRVVNSHAEVTVQVPPTIIARPQNQRVRQGNVADFECQASGIPQPQIVWTVNGRAIPSNSRYNILPSGTLRVLRVRPADAGVVNCEAANPLGARRAEATLEIIPFHGIQISSPPTDLHADSGTRIQIPCYIREDCDFPATVLWSKDGVVIGTSDGRYQITPAPESHLTISDVGQDDAGRYECTVRSGLMSARASMTLTVSATSSTEELVSRLLDLLPQSCLQNGCSDIGDRLSGLNQEEVNELVKRELGIGSREKVRRQAGSSLQQLIDGINLVSSNVDGAISKTIDHFNNRRSRQTASDMITLVRFPSTQHGIDLLRAAEIFQSSMDLVECCIMQGLTLKEFSFPRVSSSEEHPTPPLFGTEVVSIIANLSGCTGLQNVTDCSDDICYHRKYRTADGTCNNLQHPMWGAAFTPFHRLLKPIYENGFNTPIGWDPSKLYHNHTLKSARNISLEVLLTPQPIPPTDDEFTAMTMQWGQFIDHDFDFTTMTPSIKRFSDGVDCKDSCGNHAPCFPIQVDSNDPRHEGFLRQATDRGRNATCMAFTRSSAVCGSGITSMFFSALSRREQINEVTSYHDASHVYGNGEEEMRFLRDLAPNLGLLKEGQPIEQGQKPLLPNHIRSESEPSHGTGGRPVVRIECERIDRETPAERRIPCFLCGDERCNEQISLTAIHTLWLREHNRIARVLKELNPKWDGDTIFNEARKIVGAEMQHITYSHWLPKIFGPEMRRIGDYKMYNPNSPGSVINVFAAAAFRFGHTTINPILFRLNETWGENTHGNLMLHQAFFAPYRVVREGGIDPLVRGLIAKPMKARRSDANMNSELIEKLFKFAKEVALDLGALNIQRGRDHALPFYNEWRELCNLTRAVTFDDLAGEISNAQVRQKLSDTYGTPENIDPFPGMILEDPIPGSRLGPTLACVLSEHFRRIRDNDRFWYENPGVFSPAQLTEIRQASLARVVCDNTDGLSSLPKDVFRFVPVSEFVPCHEIPRLDLRAWKECCDTCNGEEEEDDPNTLSAHLRRKKRSVEKTESRSSKKAARRSRKRGSKKESKLRAPVTLHDRQEVFNELIWSQSLRAASDPQEILDISKSIAREDNADMEKTMREFALHETTDVKVENPPPQEQEPSAKPGSDEVKLLRVIQALESRVASLQDEVQRLSEKVDK